MEAERMLHAEEVGELADQLRVDTIRCSTRAGSGHPTSSLSAADLLAVLISRHLRYDWTNPRSRANDHLIFSKGHASPLLYAVFKAVGAISDEELVDTYRQFGSRLQGHPTPALPWVDVATGSLGQGLPVAVGIALAGQHLDHLPFHVWVLCGDSETAEGSIWEALDKAGHYGLRNLTAIVDVNRLGQRGPTELEWDLDTYRRRIEAFGCQALVIDGHDLAAIDDALSRARQATGPTVVLARTVKGKGVPEIENQPDWHGKSLKPDQAERAVAALGGVRQTRVSGPRPEPVPPVPTPTAAPPALPRYDRGTKVATRNAYGEALRAVGARPDVVALDGEVSDSTRADRFAEAYPERFFEMFISEQQLVAAAVGLQVRGYRPFASSFAAFLSRAYDFIRMAGISRADIVLSGSHAGVEIGADGPSQMGLEDLAALRAVHGSTVLYPSDAVSCAALVARMVDHRGVTYLRTTRGAHPVLYDNDDSFPIGGSKLLRTGGDDQVALVGAGVTAHNCLAAADRLAGEGIGTRVIDLYSVKPVDRDRLLDAVRATGGRLVVVEDHYPEGGLGSAVLEALADLAEVRVTHLAVRGLPTSGTPAELMDQAGIGPEAITRAARALVSGSR
ncbi:transketolase [Micromonospora sp. WMMA1363]|uniref:transketolase n=1 Tax=Micromonospora sp. WMMA1363 TaxID=3053985 RepID=UPI00259CAF49|nr:transketolase [Micromonospora sp. WMMA1363]MDM4719282.1 transketolase [Micromonospora sp. WMMA1363]